MRDILQEIWSNMRRNKLRTALTGFAVAWGIFMLIFLLGAGNGLINAMEDSSGDYLANSMRVSPGRTTKPWKGHEKGRWIRFDDKDVALVLGEEFSDNVLQTSAQLYQGQTIISHGKEYINESLTGVEPVKKDIDKIEILYGRFINELDLRDERKVIVLGSDDARTLLGVSGKHEEGMTPLQKAAAAKALLGEYVNVGGIPFRVVGISRPDETGWAQTFIPFTTLRTLFGRGKRVDNILFTFKGLETKEQNEAFEKRLVRKIAATHEAAPDDENVAWIWNRFTNNMEFNKGMSIIRTALWIVGILTLLSGIVGVSNIMLISVKERTHEFGIRKAIGAKPGSLLRMIIVESVLVTAFFGYIGMFIGVLANEWLNATSGAMSMDAGFGKMYVFLNPTVGLDVCFGATILLIVAGTFAGLAPARKAANVRPIEALREE